MQGCADGFSVHIPVNEQQQTEGLPDAAAQSEERRTERAVHAIVGVV